MLLDPQGTGYSFKVHRCRANWAVQWGKAANHSPPKEMNWAPSEIDATQSAARDGGGLCRLSVTRDADGSWSISCQNWNNGKGATVRFSDSTTTSFDRLVLLGTPNFDEQLFNRITLSVTGREPVLTTARSNSAFLNSVGVVTTFPDRGQPLPKTIEMVKYCGFRWVRGGIEGLTESGPTTLQTFLELHRQTGVRFSWGLVSGGTDIRKLMQTARTLAEADALLAFEGNNEPNNWGVNYQGVDGGGRAATWLPVARLQRDLYSSIKNDPGLRKYPVWSISESGAQIDNVGLQFLKIPPQAGTLLPEGTQYADYANVHNYIYHPGSPAVEDNKTWNAADPTSACKVDGLYGNFGRTWARHFQGYSEADLVSLPKVTTETGTTIEGAITEEIHGLNLLSMYLDQFKRGWTHTAVYLLRDRTDEAGNQSFGFFRADYSPRKAAVYLHNLMSILSDEGSMAKAGQLSYSIPDQPSTVHELLLQKSDGTFQLMIWGERVKGSDEVTVKLGATAAKLVIYDPTIGVEPIKSHKHADSVTVTVSDHPLVITFLPN